MTLAKLETFEYIAAFRARTRYSAQYRFGDVGIDAPEGYDFEVARQKLRKQLGGGRQALRQHEARLNDQRFLTKADPETATEVEQRSKALRGQRNLLSEQLRQLG